MACASGLLMNQLMHFLVAASACHNSSHVKSIPVGAGGLTGGGFGLRDTITGGGSGVVTGFKFWPSADAAGPAVHVAYATIWTLSLLGRYFAGRRALTHKPVLVFTIPGSILPSSGLSKNQPVIIERVRHVLVACWNEDTA